MTQIILLNFSAKEAEAIKKAGYEVERGIMGRSEAAGKSIPFWAPHPLYEYDVLFYKSTVIDELLKEFPNCKNLAAETGSLNALRNLGGSPKVRVSFIENETGFAQLIQGGVGFIELHKAEDNVSVFLDTTGNAFQIDPVHTAIAGLKSQIVKVTHFVTAKDPYPFFHVPALLAKNGSTIAAYGTTYESQGLPAYIVLPQLKNIAQGVIAILKALEKSTPALFPDRSDGNWSESDEFLLPDEKNLNDKINRIIAETVSTIEKLKRELVELQKVNAYVRKLLTATEDPKIDISERLSSVVRKSFEFLGFQVEDIDEKTKSAIKKEDFWVKDGDYLGITEVTGTVNVNPKAQEFNAIAGRMMSIYKRKTDLTLPEGVTVKGLLVLNYDTLRHPSSRPKAYTGELEHLVKSAEEQDIGILSTVELHKIIVAVMEGLLSPEDARNVLKTSGRIEFDSSRQKKKPEGG